MMMLRLTIKKRDEKMTVHPIKKSHGVSMHRRSSCLSLHPAFSSNESVKMELPITTAPTHTRQRRYGCVKARLFRIMATETQQPSPNNTIVHMRAKPKARTHPDKKFPSTESPSNPLSSFPNNSPVVG
jgi:hypothetical protein